jgi:hypothetical protein
LSVIQDAQTMLNSLRLAKFERDMRNSPPN